MRKKLIYAIFTLLFIFTTAFGATVEGTGKGYKGDIKVKVTYSGNEITNIEILKCSDSSFTKKAIKSIIKTIISTQNTDVDLISGASYTSEGLKEAVNNAVATAGITLVPKNEKSKITE